MERPALSGLSFEPIDQIPLRHCTHFYRFSQLFRSMIQRKTDHTAFFSQYRGQKSDRAKLSKDLSFVNYDLL